MDALSALSIAGTITQFVTFTAGLVARAVEIRESTADSTAELQNINTVYKTLQEFSSGLKHDTKTLSQLESSLKAGGLLALVIECQSDCDILLGIVGDLKVNKVKKPWHLCLRKAIEAAWKISEVRLLDDRLQRTQLTLVLLVCSISSDFQNQQQKRISKLQKDSELCRCNQERQFTELRRMLCSIDATVHHLDKVGSSLVSANSISSDDFSELEKQMQNLSIGAADIEKQQLVISSLNFDCRSVRHQAIPTAHIGTFSWAFSSGGEEGGDREGDEGEARRLLHWLRTGEGIFWVTGRPGSGKSTFMKYVANSPHTRDALREWSAPHEPLISTHYFWVFGTSLQKSQEGLLRTLLYEIFCQCPTLVEQTCPRRWTSHFPSSWSQGWAQDELRETMELLTSRESLPVAICFFIDGLDEYDGDHIEVTEVLSKLQRVKAIKICISSRPWNVFYDALGQHSSRDVPQNLHIHNLTKRDIQIYVRDRLTSHTRWDQLVFWTSDATHLIENITQKSHGVFLWVFLATNLLRNGLTNDDNLSDLIKRLDCFPSDLDSFFRHILQTVEHFYHEKMAGTLQLAKAAEQPLHLLFYSFHDQEYDERDYAIRLESRPLERRHLQKIYLRTQRRINAYCKGLLEVHQDRVEFLHRTVADYLKTPKISRELAEKSAPWFVPELSLARGFVALIKTLQLEFPRRLRPGCYESSSQMFELVSRIMSLASEAV